MKRRRRKDKDKEEIGHIEANIVEGYVTPGQPDDGLVDFSRIQSGKFKPAGKWERVELEQVPFRLRLLADGMGDLDTTLSEGERQQWKKRAGDLKPKGTAKQEEERTAKRAFASCPPMKTFPIALSRAL